MITRVPEKVYGRDTKGLRIVRIQAYSAFSKNDAKDTYVRTIRFLDADSEISIHSLE